MKKVIFTTLYLAVLVAVGLGVRTVMGAEEPAEPLPVLRRIAWTVGYQDARHILSVPDPQEVSIGDATAAPVGVTFEIRGQGEVWMLWKPEGSQAGRNDFPLQVHNMTTPPYENWNGPLHVASETVQIQVYAAPEIQHPFLIGGPDILVALDH